MGNLIILSFWSGFATLELLFTVIMEFAKQKIESSLLYCHSGIAIGNDRI
jgi:hypothetical protein